MIKSKQHEEVYKAITESGKSLLQLYIVVKEELDQLKQARADQQEHNQTENYV